MNIFKFNDCAREFTKIIVLATTGVRKAYIRDMVTSDLLTLLSR